MATEILNAFKTMEEGYIYFSKHLKTLPSMRGGLVRFPAPLGKSTHAVGQGETNMKYDLEGNPVEKC